jgi:low affinity Fe/Cu permease
MGHNHTSHMWLMVLACGGAFVLILVLPFLGLSKNWSVGLSIAFMVVLHLWMMRGHSDHADHKKGKENAR